MSQSETSLLVMVYQVLNQHRPQKPQYSHLEHSRTIVREECSRVAERGTAEKEYTEWDTRERSLICEFSLNDQSAHNREARLHEAMYDMSESHCFAQFEQPPKAVLDVSL